MARDRDRKQLRSSNHGTQRALPLRHRFVAIHAAAEEQLAVWRGSVSTCVGFMAKLQVLLDGFLRGDQPAIQMLVRRLAQDTIYGVDGLRELGPKQKKGGTPRVFYLRRTAGTFLVAAGMETGTGGAQAMDIAKTRAQAIILVPEPTTDAEVTRIWAAAYGIRFGSEYRP